MTERQVGWGHRIAMALFAALAAFGASAQVLDRVEVTAEGANAVVRIRFNVQIQYLRHAPQARGSTIQTFFQITIPDDSATTVVEEERRPPPQDLVPRFRVVYPSQPPGLQRRIEIVFETPVEFRLRPEDSRTLLLLIPLTADQIDKLRPLAPAGVELPPTRVTAEPASDVDRQAEAQMKDGREAMAAGIFDKAVVAFHRVLNLPPNAFSQEAQEFIGLAREKDGDLARARAEYELYLKLYPDSPAAPRDRERVTALAGAPAGPRVPVRPAQTTWWGSLAQTYYGGKSTGQLTTTTITPATNATTIDTVKLSSEDQKLLVSTLDATARYRDTNWDSRAVVREQYNANFLEGKDNVNKLNALYAEARYLPNQLFGRMGRQSATSNGVLGRFDGAVGSWGFMPNARVAAVVGQPVDTYAGLDKTFYGGALEADVPGVAAGGNVYAIRQVVIGETDRLGVGSRSCPTPTAPSRPSSATTGSARWGRVPACRSGSCSTPGWWAWRSPTPRSSASPSTRWAWRPSTPCTWATPPRPTSPARGPRASTRCSSTRTTTTPTPTSCASATSSTWWPCSPRTGRSARLSNVRRHVRAAALLHRELRRRA